MNAPFNDNKDLFLANARKKDEQLKDAEETRKMIRDSESASSEPPFQLGEWIEGNVG